MSKHKPTPNKQTSASAASAAWRKKNAQHVREYKRAYYRKKKLQSEQDALTLQIIADTISSLAAQLDRVESALHRLQNGPAIKAASASSSTRKMFS